MKVEIKSWKEKVMGREKAESRQFISDDGLGAVEVLNKG